VHAARPASIAVLALGLSPAAATVETCRILVSPPMTMPWVATDAGGFARTAVAIPNEPFYLGVQLFGQYVVFDAAGALLDGIGLSHGLWVRLGT
jgi:hypothetical protein